MFKVRCVYCVFLSSNQQEACKLQNVLANKPANRANFQLWTTKWASFEYPKLEFMPESKFAEIGLVLKIMAIFELTLASFEKYENFPWKLKLKNNLYIKCMCMYYAKA